MPLGDEEYFEASAFPAQPDLPHRLRLFADAYGVADGALVRWALQQSMQRQAEAMRAWPISAAEAGKYLRLVARSLEWFGENASRLTAHFD